MGTRVHSGQRRYGRGIAVAVSLLGLIVLQLFPLHLHHFAQRIRPSQELSQIQRHIFVAQPEAGPAQRIADNAGVSVLSLSIETVRAARLMPGFEVISGVPVTRLLLRLKLGSSRSSSPDPLV
jgi:hypothetical protein